MLESRTPNDLPPDDDEPWSDWLTVTDRRLREAQPAALGTQSDLNVMATAALWFIHDAEMDLPEPGIAVTPNSLTLHWTSPNRHLAVTFTTVLTRYTAVKNGVITKGTSRKRSPALARRLLNPFRQREETHSS